MDADSLGQLLRDADGRAAAPAATGSAHDMVAAVLKRKRSRAKRRVGAGGVVVVLGLASLVAWLANEPSGRHLGPDVAVSSTVVTTTANASTPIDLDRARTAARQSVASADLYEAVVARVEESSRSRSSASSRANRYATAEVRLGVQREESTLLLLHQGDVLAREPDLRKQAEASYRQAADMFPETRGAVVAKQRLDALN